jgi:myo-inositol-1(or 4)-monophosphatase
MNPPGDPRPATPQAGAPELAPERWLEAFRRAVSDQREIFARNSDIGGRSEYEGVGEGGDRTLVIDRLCEDAVFAELERLHADGLEFLAIAEERGEVAFGSAESPLRVVIDPIDGSLNARRTIPCHSLSIAVHDGDSMADAAIAFNHEFGADEEFVAVRGAGASLDGEPIEVLPGDGLEVVAMEATRPERMLAALETLDGRAYRIRTTGSIAVSLCYVAAGRFDGMLSTRHCRSVDAAAGQLIVREAGGFISFAELELEATGLDLGERYHVIAARTERDLEVLREAQRALP